MQHPLASWQEDQDAESDGEEAAAFVARRDAATVLSTTGLRRELALGLAAPVAEEAGLPLLLLSWALLVALLLSCPADSHTRKQLSQVILDLDR